MFDSVLRYGLLLSRFLCPRDPLGKNTGVGCHALHQAIFQTRRLNLCLLSPELAGGFFTTSAIREAQIMTSQAISEVLGSACPMAGGV